MVRTFPNYNTTNTQSNKCSRAATMQLRTAWISNLCDSAVLQTVLQLQLVHPRGAQRPGRVRDESTHLVLHVTHQTEGLKRVSLWFFPPTCSSPAGFPRSIEPGEQRRLRWHQSSQGYTAKTTLINSLLLRRNSSLNGSQVFVFIHSCVFSQETKRPMDQI